MSIVNYLNVEVQLKLVNFKFALPRSSLFVTLHTLFQATFAPSTSFFMQLFKRVANYQTQCP